MAHSGGISLLIFLVFGPVLAMQVGAQPLVDPPGRSGNHDLRLVDTHVLKLDGRSVEDADIYFSKLGVYFLVVSDQLKAPLMISSRQRLVQWIGGKYFEKRGPIDALLRGEAASRVVGRYDLRHDGVHAFDLNGVPAELAPAPPLLGRQSLTSMKNYHPLLAYRAASHNLKRTDLKTLPIRKGEVLVEFFFSSRDPLCKLILPRILKFEESLRGPKKNLRFEYYGLPRRILDDEKAKGLDIWGVPLAIVYVDGKEVGRVRAAALGRPEENLLPLLAGSPAP